MPQLAWFCYAPLADFYSAVDTCVTSPPYFGLRDYGVDGQIGLEETPEAYVGRIVEVFREVRRVLRDDGTLWLNLGDSYWATRSKNGLEDTQDYKFNNKVRARIHAGGKSHPILKPKDLIGIPWRVAFALQADGWYLRQDIIWHKPNPMPESVTDRCTKAHEYIFLLSKSPRYYFDNEAVAEAATTKENRPHGIVRDREYGYDSKQKIIRAMWREPNQDNYHGKRGTTLTRKKMQSAMRDFSDKETMLRYATQGRNRRSVWTVSTKPFKGAHFATFPPDLIEPCILAGAPVGGVVLDPFLGSGTTAMVAKKLGRSYIGIELNPNYIELARSRIGSQLTLSLEHDRRAA